MKTDISDLRAQIIEEARKRIARPPDKDEITIIMLTEELGISEWSARRLLNGLVEEGKATVRRNGPDECNVYKMK